MRVTKEFLQEIGSLGGLATKVKNDPNYFREIGKLGGQKQGLKKKLEDEEFRQEFSLKVRKGKGII